MVGKYGREVWLGSMVGKYGGEVCCGSMVGFMVWKYGGKGSLKGKYVGEVWCGKMVGEVWWGSVVGKYGAEVWCKSMFGKYDRKVWWGSIVGKYCGGKEGKNQIHFVLLLLSALVKRFSVSHMLDFQSIGPLGRCFL